jgi:hypothetical protein
MTELPNKAAAAGGRQRFEGSRWLVYMVSLVDRSLIRSAAGAESPAAEPQRR